MREVFFLNYNINARVPETVTISVDTKLKYLYKYANQLALNRKGHHSNTLKAKDTYLREKLYLIAENKI